MTAKLRHNQILDYLQEHSLATVSQLVDLLQCSPATVRRDISDLDTEGKLKKIRNGAEKILSPTVSTSPGMVGFYPTISDYSNYEESDRIAQKAVALCQEKDNIFIGEGQTPFLMGKYLLNSNVHVYSNYLPLLTYLISQNYPHLVVLGGQYIKSQNLLVSPDTHVSYQGRYMMVSGDGLTEAGLTKSALLTFMEEKKMLQYADKVIALVDSTKVGVFGGISLFTLDQIDMVITGKAADPKMIEVLLEHNIQVHLV
ncbi:HTH-type transcriptional regulator UlaR [Motilimonas cestriensis]|uniref:HTH-type transcriptional regulator UlaR n=1 Tax=Motilimonas cestriensis TaxID=2742685 RepID=A0ABS8WEW3_9GAMM|nr:HTH-type transcriptional regulator UlaR [Motilimonas cestriensis]MCE2596828.1 HTH-type transcriptional regulator UlaR [Motilimonas cestriensis]